MSTALAFGGKFSLQVKLLGPARNHWDWRVSIEKHCLRAGV